MTKIGEAAPEFELPNTSGGTTSLSKATDGGPAVIVFNRGYWCSYCAEQLQTFSALEYDLWHHLDTSVVSIIGDSIPELNEMRDRFNLSMQMCSDENLTVTHQYAGTEQTSNHGEIPIAATYVIDEDGTIRYEQIAEDPADRTYATYVRAFISNGFEKPFRDYSTDH